MTVKQPSDQPATLLSFHPVNPSADHGPIVFTGSTLIIPSPKNIGFLGQYATDLLLSNSSTMKKVGCLTSRWILPVVGNNAHEHVLSFNADKTEIATSFDVYQGKTADNAVVTIAQFRSGIIPKRSVDLSNEIALWTRDCHFKAVIVLAGADASRQLDTQLSSNADVWFSASSDCSICIPVNDMLRPLDEFATFVDQEGHSLSKLPPGVGMTHLLVKDFEKYNVQAIVLLAFVAGAGDNSLAAVSIASAVLRLVGLPDTPDKKWFFPLAWQDTVPTRSTTVSLYQ